MKEFDTPEVRRMSQQERLAHFGILCGEGKITWKEFSYIVKEIPYEPNRSSAEMVPGKKGDPIRKDRGESTGDTGLGATGVDGDATHRIARQEPDDNEMEWTSQTLVPRRTDARPMGGQGGKESDLEEKLGRIRENILSG